MAPRPAELRASATLAGIARAERPVPSTSIFAHGRSRATLELLRRGELRSLLDYGCGRGELALAAARELGLTVHACDIDAALVQQLASEHDGTVSFFAIDELRPSLPFAEGELSAVSCSDVLEHMSDDQRAAALREIRRVLAPGGALVLTTPHKGLFSAADPENFKFRFPRLHRFLYRRVKGQDKYSERYEGQRFGNNSSGAERHAHFSRRQLEASLRAAGLEVQEVSYFGLLAPVIRPLLWLSENLAERLPVFRPLRRLSWALYIRDVDTDPGPLASNVAVRAVKPR